MPADGMLAACSHAQDFGTSRLKGGYAKSSWFHSTLQPPIGGGATIPVSIVEVGVGSNAKISQ